MASEFDISKFIQSLPPQQSYLDSGYDIHLNRNLFEDNRSFSGMDFDSFVENVSLSKLSQGVTISSGRRLRIDFDKGQIMISDGALDRFVMGDYP